MKTTISIPAELFEDAEPLARQLGMSRSGLYVAALRLYLDRARGNEVTRRLDELYAGEDSALDPILARLQSFSLPREDWK